MIKRFIRRVLGLSSETTLRVPRQKHGLGCERLSPAATKVCTVQTLDRKSTRLNYSHIQKPRMPSSA